MMKLVKVYRPVNLVYLLCLLFLFLLAVLYAQNSHAAINLPPKCKLPHIKVHWGTALKKQRAQRRARRQWQKRARQMHGWSYRKWENAYKRNSQQCHKQGRWWKCAAGAYACRN